MLNSNTHIFFLSISVIGEHFKKNICITYLSYLDQKSHDNETSGMHTDGVKSVADLMLIYLTFEAESV